MAEHQRPDGRAVDALRTLKIERNYLGAAPGRVLISAGDTVVLCTASVESRVPPWMEGKGKGWITAEYNMLPGSTTPRKQRDRSKVDGRTTEIQRLIGRSLRAAVDFGALGEHTITIDCDVLQADGGTRTLSVTGGFIALCEAVHSLNIDGKVIKDSVAAISVGVVDGTSVLDLDYPEDSTAQVDMNVIMTGDGRFIEVQGTAEGHAFRREELDEMLALAEKGIREIIELQQSVLAE